MLSPIIFLILRVILDNLEFGSVKLRPIKYGNLIKKEKELKRLSCVVLLLHVFHVIMYKMRKRMQRQKTMTLSFCTCH